MAGPNKYTEQDAMEDTGASKDEVKEAWHDARDDATSAGELTERNENKVSDSSTGQKIWSILRGKGNPDDWGF